MVIAGIETAFTDKEKKIFLGALLFFAIWAFYLADAYANAFSSNIFLGTYLFISLYVIFIYGFYLKGEAVGSIGPKDWNDYIGYILIFSAFDLMAYPIMVPKAGFANSLAAVQQLSSDLAIYQGLSYAFPRLVHIAKYAITYVMAPWVMLVVARIFLTRKHFWNVVKAGA